MSKKQLIKSGLGSVAVKITFAFLSFVISVVLARTLGAEGFGVYAFVIAVVMLASVPAMAGAPDLMVRETAKYQASAKWSCMAGLWAWGNKLVIGFSSAVFIIGSLVVFLLNDLIDQDKARVLSIGLLIVPLAAMTNIKSASIRGLRHTVLGQIPDNVVRPLLLLMLISVYPIFFKNFEVVDVIFFYILASFTAFSVSALMLKKTKPTQVMKIEHPEYDDVRWKKAVLPLALISGMHVLNGYVDVIVLGLYRENEEVGVYRAVVQLSLLVSFGLQAINQVLHPHFSRLYTMKEHQKLQRLVILSARGIFLISIPPVLLLLIYGADILKLVFGDPFYVGGLALSILAIGQLINAAMGSVGALLNMTGHERHTLRGVALAAVVNMLLNFILIPYFGMLGAAIASISSLVMWNLLLRHYVKKLLNIEPSALFFNKNSHQIRKGMQ
jgi:O-antigen/teichoic acid export membrane protein